MRRYGQYCALARALDVVGERWTLLIVRELTARPSRYSDLLDGLPGIATNLLADRLRRLESEGIVARDEATTTYRLTARGEALAPVLRELVRWGAPLMADGPGDDELRAHWLPLALDAVLDGATLAHGVVVELLVSGGPSLVVAVDADGVAVEVGPAARRPDAAVSGPPDAILGLLTGVVSLRDAAAGGLEVRGSKAALRRLLSAVPTPARRAS